MSEGALRHALNGQTLAPKAGQGQSVLDWNAAEADYRQALE
jgi:hypothetical protein